MTTLKQIELTCPVCDCGFTSQDVVSTNSFGGKRTDFHERAAGTQPLPHMIHTCNRCGFSGVERDFTEPDVTEELKMHVREEIMQSREFGGVLQYALTGSLKYEFAAKCAIWQDCGLREIGDLWLRAAWCCVDEGDTEAERYYRRKAAETFSEALGSYDGVPKDERAVITYLVGELWRRWGDPRRAALWFDKVPFEINAPESQKWIEDAARQQRDCPREWFA